MRSASPLVDLLCEAIRTRGAIPFREFMSEALYHPEHGYYSTPRAIGRRGDFFTNVSVGPIFGALLARQFAEIWRRLGEPDSFTIVEQGAHRGEFALDTLGSLQQQDPRCFAATRYRIIEPAPALQVAQIKMLTDFADKVSWSESLEQTEAFTGVHFSNELLDALPVHRVTRVAEGWKEQYVALHGGRFVFVDEPLSDEALGQHLTRLPELPPDYRTEVNLAALGWVDALAAKLTRGFALTIDYGFARAEYYAPQRSAGTLAAYTQHRREAEVLARPGEIDLTAHVEFTGIAERGIAAGMRLRGFTDQHHFMVGLSKLHFGDTETLSPAEERERRSFKMLMHPALMGQSFKVICLDKGVTATEPLAGFQFARNPRAALGL